MRRRVPDGGASSLYEVVKYIDTTPLAGSAPREAGPDD
jgi:hypothetical protein